MANALRVQFRLDPELNRALRAYATQKSMRLSEAARLILATHLRNPEDDIYGAAMARGFQEGINRAAGRTKHLLEAAIATARAGGPDGS